jgi:tetratricopeptide (TPR) repeat protein
MRKTLLVVLLVCTAAAVCCGLICRKDYKYDYMLKRALQLRVAGDKAEIVPVLDRAVKIDPQRDDAFVLKYYFYKSIGDYNRAFDAANRHIAATGSPYAYLNRAEVLLASGYKEQALSELSFAGSFVQSKPDFYFNLASLYCAADDYKNSLENVRTAVKYIRSSGDYYFFSSRYLAAELNYKQGNYADALKNLEGLDGFLKNAPYLLSSVNNLRAKAELARKEYKEALVFADAAVANLGNGLYFGFKIPVEDNSGSLCGGKIKTYSLPDVYMTRSVIKAQLKDKKGSALDSAKVKELLKAA